MDDAGNIESVCLVVQPAAPKPERIWAFLNARKLIARLKARRQRRSTAQTTLTATRTGGGPATDQAGGRPLSRHRHHRHQPIHPSCDASGLPRAHDRYGAHRDQ
ncbi:MAG: hypothetical protein MUE49_12335 [Rhodospirillales bacterium]|nr:hypothetical protein [Rhodospirillales bacterium]